jgi:hypothetical protein
MHQKGNQRDQDDAEKARGEIFTEPKRSIRASAATRIGVGVAAVHH